MEKEQAVKLIETYGRAWVTRDADLVLTVFTPDATHFDPGDELEQRMRAGHAQIRDYWEHKVIASQEDVAFELLDLWMDGNTVIARWRAQFTDTARNLRIDMTAVVICGVDGDRFSSFHQCYMSKKRPL